ncbi:MAG: hypothetical protein J0H69_08500 [Burkholderiales bacterium]|nr:hypothetical protein [Burkholderiales bacterium]
MPRALSLGRALDEVERTTLAHALTHAQQDELRAVMNIAEMQVEMGQAPVRKLRDQATARPAALAAGRSA